MKWWPIISDNRKQRSNSERQQIPLQPPMQHYPPYQKSEGDDKKFYHENDIEPADGPFKMPIRGVVIIDM
jgi:hypothetical protein